MNRLAKWAEFYSYVLKGKKTSQLKIDVIFQIMHYILNDGKEPTPFHVTLAQAVHSLTRSKELVTALNHHGICVSYNIVKRYLLKVCNPLKDQENMKNVITGEVVTNVDVRKLVSC